MVLFVKRFCFLKYHHEFALMSCAIVFIRRTLVTVTLPTNGIILYQTTNKQTLYFPFILSEAMNCKIATFVKKSSKMEISIGTFEARPAKKRTSPAIFLFASLILSPSSFYSIPSHSKSHKNSPVSSTKDFVMSRSSSSLFLVWLVCLQMIEVLSKVHVDREGPYYPSPGIERDYYLNSDFYGEFVRDSSGYKV